MLYWLRRRASILAVMASVLLLSGCLGGTSGAKRYDVSVEVTLDGVGLSGVVVEDEQGSELGVTNQAGLVEISGLSGTVTLVPKKGGYLFDPVSETVSKQASVTFIASEDPNARFVSTADELADATSNTEVTSIILGADITADVSVNRLVDLYFQGFTLTGSITIDTEDAGTLLLAGPGTVTGDLTVQAPNATVYNELQVNGSVNVGAVADRTWYEEYDDNTLHINAAGIQVYIMFGARRVAVYREQNQIHVQGPVGAFEANSSVEVSGGNHIQNALVNSPGVSFDRRPVNVDPGSEFEPLIRLGMAEGKSMIEGLQNLLLVPTAWLAHWDEIGAELEQSGHVTDLDSLMSDLSQGLEPMLGGHFLELEPGYRYTYTSYYDFYDNPTGYQSSEPIVLVGQTEAAWELVIDGQYVLRYSTETWDLLQQIMQQMQQIGATALEPQGNIWMSVTVENLETTAQLEAMVSLQAAVSENQVSIFDISDIYLEANYVSPAETLLHLDGHVAVELDISGTVPELEGISLQGSLDVGDLSFAGTIEVTGLPGESMEAVDLAIDAQGTLELAGYFQADGQIILDFDINSMTLNAVGVSFASLIEDAELEISTLNMVFSDTGESETISFAVDGFSSLDGTDVGVDVEGMVERYDSEDQWGFSVELTELEVTQTGFAAVWAEDFSIELDDYAESAEAILLISVVLANADQITLNIGVDSQLSEPFSASLVNSEGEDIALVGFGEAPGLEFVFADQEAIFLGFPDLALGTLRFR